MPTDLLTVQPPPTGDGDVWSEVLADEPPGSLRDLMAARREQGIAKYGRPLGRTNGRDHIADAMQEALDGIVYARAADCPSAEGAFRMAASALLRVPRKVG